MKSEREYQLLWALVLTVLMGCTLEPPHNNLADPDHYNYTPIGQVQILVLDAEVSGVPIENAEVRIPELNRLEYTDTSGIMILYQVPVGRYWVYAEQRGNGVRAYAVDSLEIAISESITSVDTFRLTPLPLTPGQLSVQVLDKGSRPIETATVIITEHGKFALTNENGNALLEDIPPGDVWVTAYRSEPLEPVYVSDSLLVSINPGGLSYASFRLDALPEFIEVSATSNGYGLATASIFHRVRLKARTQDSDGPSDVRYVTYSYNDTTNGLILGDTLEWYANQDSMYWWMEIPSDSFYNGNIDNARNSSFLFKAIDADGNIAQASTSVLNVIHYYPQVDPLVVNPQNQPTIQWYYYWRDEFRDTTLFNYLLRITKEDIEPIVIYDTLIVPISQSNPSHQVADVLEQGNYYFYIWVIDRFGNFSRSLRGSITGVPPP